MADSPFGNIGIGNFSPMASLAQGGPSQYMSQYSPLYMLYKNPDMLKYLSPAYAMASGGPSSYFQHFSPLGMAMGGLGGGGGGQGGGGGGGGHGGGGGLMGGLLG